MVHHGVSGARPFAAAPPGEIDDFPATVFTFRLVAQSRRKPVAGKYMISPQLYALLVHAHFPQGRGNKSPRRRLMGKHLRSGRAGISPLAFFSLDPVHQFLPGAVGRGRRGNNTTTTTTTQQHDGVSHGSRAIYRGQGVSVNPFGCPPSL